MRSGRLRVAVAACRVVSAVAVKTARSPGIFCETRGVLFMLWILDYESVETLYHTIYILSTLHVQT